MPDEWSESRLATQGVSLKIVCVEEHTVDSAIAKAAQPAVASEAGFMADWGSRVVDAPIDYTRPHQVALHIALERARDLASGRLAAMDQNGVTMQILSYSNVAQLAPASDAVALTRTANDKLAEAVHANPARFAAFAILPWQNPDAAAAELERAVKELGFVGTLIQGRPGDTFLDDPRYQPVLAKLNELQVPLYVHPGYPLPQVREPYYGGLDKEVSARLSTFAWGWHNEAGVHVIRMMLVGVFEQFPSLQIISGHWGEMVPFFLQRLDDTIPRAATGFSRSLTEIYKAHVYVTPSGMLNLPHFEFIHKVLGADRILYSIDYPYVTLNGAREFLESLPISVDEKEKIAYRNAEELFRL